MASARPGSGAPEKPISVSSCATAGSLRTVNPLPRRGRRGPRRCTRRRVPQNRVDRRSADPPRSGLENHLLAVVLLVLEELVAAWRLGQRQSVGYHTGGVELSALDAREQWPHVPLHVALTGPQRAGPVHPRARRKLVDDPPVDPDDRDDAAAAA